MFLILAAGMFVGPCNEKLGISFYMPEDWFISMAVCGLGTLMVFLFMYVGHKVIINFIVQNESKKRVRGNGELTI